MPTRVLHAPGSLLTYEPQWGSDVLSMFQSMVDGRQVKRELLLQDVPEDKHNDLDFLVDLVDWERNTDATFGINHYIEPIVAAGSESEGYVDKWVVYGRVGNEQRFSAKELTVQPGARCLLHDNGASGLIVTQGHGTIGKLKIDCPASIRFGQMTQDEVFISAEAALSGVTVENHSATDPLVRCATLVRMCIATCPTSATTGATSFERKDERMREQHFEAKNEKIKEQFRELKKKSPEKLKCRLNLSWSNWGFGRESLQDSAKRLEKAKLSFIELHGNHYGPDLGYKVDETSEGSRRPRPQSFWSLRHVFCRQRYG